MLKPSASSTEKIPIGLKRLIPALGCIGISLILLFVLRVSGFFSYADTSLYDFLLGQKVNYAPKALNSQIIPVDLNDKSEMNLGERLDNRSAFGDLFSVLAYSRAQVVLDFIYKGEQAQDAYMLEGADKIPELLVAVIPVPEGRENSSYRELNEQEKALLRKNLWHPKEFGKGTIKRAGTFVMPFPELGERATQLAHISIDPDSDGIFRRTPLFYAWEDGFIPAISLASALLELGVNGNDIEIHYGKEVVIPLGPDEKISIPIDSSGNVVVPFGGKWVDTTHRYSFDTLANAQLDNTVLNDVRNDIMGSLCFVADTTFEKKDLGPIPFEKVYLLSGLHSWVISAILDASQGEDTFFRESPALYRTLCLVLFAALLIVLGMSRKDWIFNAGSAGLFFVFTVITLYLWFFHRVMPWYAAAFFGILFTWLFGFMYRFLTHRKRQSALERYVPRQVAQKVVADRRTDLVPETRVLTILFTDIKSFTKWSGHRTAQEVHDFLNDYLESMAEILFSHDATVDKFIGDGILAFFNAPLEMTNHAGVAIEAAIEMQKKIRELAEKWKPIVGIDLQVRMGINTGEVVVGELGTSRRIEYTVIGGDVNLAQRMESEADPGGILVTEFTKNSVDAAFSKGAFTFGEKKELRGVKGYEDKVITAYKVEYQTK